MFLRIASCAIPVLCVACPSGPQTPPAQPEQKSPLADVRIGWNEPYCFAYAADSDSYACLDFAMRVDKAGPEELEPMDFTKYQPDPDIAWSGHKSFVQVAAERSTIELTKKNHDAATDVTRPLSQLAALTELEQRGYRPAGIVATSLEPGEWVDIAGLSLRFRSRYHTADDKDPDDYYMGSLQLVCPDAMVSSAIELLPGKRGQLAVVFHAPEAKSLVVSVVESGGTGGAWYFKILNVRVDPASRCQG